MAQTDKPSIFLLYRFVLLPISPIVALWSLENLHCFTAYEVLTSCLAISILVKIHIYLSYLISHYGSQVDSLSKILYKSCDFVSNSLFLIHLKKYGHNTIG
jgi:hypothetical protein